MIAIAPFESNGVRQRAIIARIDYKKYGLPAEPKTLPEYVTIQNNLGPIPDGYVEKVTYMTEERFNGLTASACYVSQIDADFMIAPSDDLITELYFINQILTIPIILGMKAPGPGMHEFFKIATEVIFDCDVDKLCQAIKRYEPIPN